MNTKLRSALVVGVGVILGLILSIPITAHADTGAILDVSKRGYFVTRSGYKMTIGTAGSDTFNIVASNTPIASVDTNGINFVAGKGVIAASNVPTMAATPVSGTNDLKVGMNVVPTAAANTAALTAATPVVGTKYIVYNSNSANAVRLKPGGASAINGATAGKYVEISATDMVECLVVDASNLKCYTLTATALKTPAGP